VSFPYNVRNVSVEWAETETPVRFLRRELVADSGGPGECRGGLGEELALTVEPTADVSEASPLTLSGSAGRMRYPAEGVAGGWPGSRGSIEVNGEAIPATSAPEVQFRPGDVVQLRTPGGGGHGPPADRPIAAIDADLRDGYITSAAIGEPYGASGLLRGDALPTARQG
jgi:N-methylhydantoinase B